MELFTFYRMLICLWVAVILLVFAQGSAGLAMFGVCAAHSCFQGASRPWGVQSLQLPAEGQGQGQEVVHRGDLLPAGSPSGSDSQEREVKGD